jgi:hypothetical protein
MWTWNRAVIKSTRSRFGLITRAPATGIQRIGPRGKLRFVHAASKNR